MKSTHYFDRYIVLFFAAVAVAAATGQVHAQSFTGAKVAAIYSEAFYDDKAGVIRLTSAVKRVENQYKPVRDELDRMNSQLSKLSDEIKAGPQSGATPAALQAKVDQAQTLDREIKRKGGDAQASMQKAHAAAVGPIMQDLAASLEAYSKARGIDMVLDLSKGNNIYLYNQAVDITDAFIADYNKKYPAAAGN